MLYKKPLLVTFCFISFLFVLQYLQHIGTINIFKLACDPNNGPFSIFTGVFLHGNLDHLISNCKSLIVTLPLLLKFYGNKASLVFLLGLFIPSFSYYFLVGTPMVGISGFCFCLIWFIVFSGFSSKKLYKIMISIVLGVNYASTLTGITPEAGCRIAWQAHLTGFITAILIVVFYNLHKKPIE